jgi:adenylate cyclase
MAEANRAARQRPEKLQAWALCVQAQTTAFLQMDFETKLAATKLVQRAVEIEPDYGPAWAQLARRSALSVWDGTADNPSADRDQALVFARKALSLAPQDPAVLGDCGCTYLYAGNYASALDCLERSLKINPNDTSVRSYYGLALVCDHRAEAGIEQLDSIMRLSLRNVFASLTYLHYILCYTQLGDFAKVEQFAFKMIQEAPNSFYPYQFYAASLIHQGRFDEAKQQIQQMRLINPHITRKFIEDYLRRFPGGPDFNVKTYTAILSKWPD